MILKYFNLNNKILEQSSFFLLFGSNAGLKNEIIKKIIKDNQIFTYHEDEILSDVSIFFENITTKSFFETNKNIIIKKSTDKILKTIEQIIDKKLDDITIILEADNLEKKSKLRSFFEKEKNLISIPFYPDNVQTLLRLAKDFLDQKNISISYSDINNIVNKCRGDRENLFNELKKIENYQKNGKKITTEIVSKLTNTIENYSISELVDNCLSKNRKKTIDILNENNFNSEDCIVITRTFLNKAKKILILSTNYQTNKNIDLTISSARPPIFWKDKDIIKQQIFKWPPKKIKKLIYETSEIELLVKKNISNSINLVTDFIILQASTKVNS